MFRQMIVAAVAAGLIDTTGTVASSKVRHHGYGYDAPRFPRRRKSNEGERQ